MLFLLLPFGLDFQHDFFDLLELIRGQTPISGLPASTFSLCSKYTV